VSLSPVEQGGDDIVAEINVTPLTDIFLVLLIIFMVTSTAMLQQGTPVNLPRTGAGGSEATGIVVTATADGHLEVNGKAVERPALQSALESELQNSPDKRIVLQGDRQVILEDAVQIMTIAKLAGAEKISIATEPAKR
jgi:biopolymer transport protein ExbD